ncbi:MULTISPECIES: hypothetical protein [unclassified Methylobacterium]|jgi:hypothetical protein|uniref:hypothetical protein n=1 Tax=unclassified Methylobacterium TaxID=2615210 RepID=UPI0006F6A95D|nr:MULTISPECIES: hypothetical protein [unclassified Methylobacterium]KQO57614.1 hypothetical protein ASF24_17310 [Methylobacterium sp. Leaf86]KQO94582.1 hypothetical protein ASF32_18840 [Methylobacterium sp. Leaf91]
MSNTEHQTQAQDRSADLKAAPAGPVQAKPAVSPSIIALAGGIVAAGAIAAFLLMGGGEMAGTAERPALNLVKTSEIDKAAETLVPEEKEKLVTQAKACTAPLGNMRLSKMTANAGGVVRIRAGNYLSPAFNVAEGPINIAVPFPAPYEVGRGEIVVEGAAKDVFFELTPGLKIDTTGGVQRIPVIWNTSKPCGG